MIWIVAACLLGLVLVYRAWPSTRPAGLGVHEGQLRPCPDSPNCVCSQATDEQHRIESIPIQGDGQTEWQALLTAIEQSPRCHVVTSTENYLHAECSTAVFRFVDDLELFLDIRAGVIQLRSASRTGHSDLGVNRQRIEHLRQAAQL